MGSTGAAHTEGLTCTHTGVPNELEAVIVVISGGDLRATHAVQALIAVEPLAGLDVILSDDSAGD
jgi:hypothetical protein